MHAVEPLSAGESIVIGLIVAVVVTVPLLWAGAAHFWRMTHEGAHVLLAVILGLTVTEIWTLLWLAGGVAALLVGGKLLVLG
jgi:hypothetical protein